MPTRSIVLTEHQEAHLVERQEADDKARLKALREAARVGIEDIEARRVRDFTSNLEIRAHFESRTQRTIARSRVR